MELSVGSGLGVCRGAWRRRKMRCILYTSLLAALATSTLGNTAPHLRHFDLIVVKVYRHRSGLLLHHISASRTVRVFCRDSLSETKARRYHNTRQRSTTPDRQPYTATKHHTPVLPSPPSAQPPHNPCNLLHTAPDLPKHPQTHLSPNMTLAEEFRSRNFSKRAIHQPLGA